MKLPSLPVLSFSGATLNFDKLQKELTLQGTIRSGSGELEWTVKAHETAVLSIVTGLTSVTSFVGLSTNQILVGYTGITGGTVTVTGYDVAGEPGAGTKTGLY